MIVNPSAGGGRAARALPAVEAELTRLGIEHHVERTQSLEHAARAGAGPRPPRARPPSHSAATA